MCRPAARFVPEAAGVGRGGVGQAVDDERDVRAVVGVADTVGQVEGLHHADQAVGQLGVVLGVGQVRPQPACVRRGEHPAGVGDRLAVNDLGDAGVEPFGLQDDLGGEVGDAGEVGDLAEVMQHPGDGLLGGGVGDAGLSQAAEGAVGGDGQLGQLVKGAGGGVPGGGPAGAHQGQGGGVAGNGVAQLADAEPRAGVDGADRGDARIAVGQVVRERGWGVFVAVGGDQQDRGVGGAGGDGVEPGGDLPVGGAGAGVPTSRNRERSVR